MLDLIGESAGIKGYSVYEDLPARAFLDNAFTKELKLSKASLEKFKTLGVNKSHAGASSSLLRSRDLKNESEGLAPEKLKESSSGLKAEGALKPLESFKYSLSKIKDFARPVYDEVEHAVDELQEVEKALENFTGNNSERYKLETKLLDLKIYIKDLLSDSEEQLESLDKEVKYLEVFKDEAKRPSKWSVTWRKALDKLCGTKLAKTYVEEKKIKKIEYFQIQKRAVTLAAIAALNIEKGGVLNPNKDVVNTRLKLMNVAGSVFRRKEGKTQKNLQKLDIALSRLKVIDNEIVKLKTYKSPAKSVLDQACENALPKDMKTDSVDLFTESDFEKIREEIGKPKIAKAKEKKRNKLEAKKSKVNQEIEYLKYAPKFELTDLVARIFSIEAFKEARFEKDVKLNKTVSLEPVISHKIKVVLENFISPKLRKARCENDLSLFKEKFLEARAGWLSDRKGALKKGKFELHDITGEVIGEFIPINSAKKKIVRSVIDTFVEAHLEGEVDQKGQMALVDLVGGNIIETEDGDIESAIKKALREAKVKGQIGIFRLKNG